jgi:Fe-S-cluster containining protein
MLIPINKIICDPDQKYSCSDCTDTCCKSFSIIIDQAGREKLLELNCVTDRILETNLNFEPQSQNNFYLPVIKDGESYSCLFFNHEEKCTIHATYGYNFKPAACQLFPFAMYFDLHNNIHLETSYCCNSILYNYGTNLTDIKNYLPAHYINLEFYPEKFPLYDRQIDQELIFKTASILKNILEVSDNNIDIIVFNYHQVLTAIKHRLYTNQTLTSDIYNTDHQPQKNKISAANRFAAQATLNLYLTNLSLYSTYNRKNSLFHNPYKLIKQYLQIYFSFYKCSRSAHLPFLQNTNDLYRAQRMPFIIDNKSKSLIKRYLKSSVIRYKAVKQDFNDLHFFNRPILYYFMIKEISKIIALKNNRETIEEQDVAQSIYLVEFTFYHTTTPIVPAKRFEKFFKNSIHRLLNKPDVIAYLLFKQ